MKRTLLLSLFLSILLFTGCEKDSTEETPTEPEVNYIITLSDVPEVLVGIEGAPRSFSFLISVTTDEDLVVSNKTVSLREESGVGVFENIQITTNNYGIARGTYSFDIPEGQNTLTLIAELDGFTGSADLRVISLNKPDMVDLTAEKNTYVGIEDENVRVVMNVLLTDEHSNGVSGVSLAFGIEPMVEGGAIYGVLSSPDATDANGEAELVFQSHGGFGAQKIYCRINEPDGYLSEVNDELILNIQSLNDVVGSFIVRPSPEYLEVSSADPETSKVDIFIRDQDNVGIEGIRVNVTTDVGYIMGRAETDPLGAASVTYIVEAHNFADTTHSATIYASIPGTDWVAQSTISLVLAGVGQSYIRLTTDTQSILADNGITKANLTAVLRDEYNQAVVGQSMRFASNYGLVPSPITTDENGIARTVFIDNGLPSIDDLGFPDSAVVRAYVPALDAEDEVKIIILPWDAVDSLGAGNPPESVVVGGADSCAISARAFRPNGTLLGNGTLIHFEPTYGITSPRQALTVNGEAEVKYFSPFNAGKDTVAIWTLFDGERIETRAIVTVIPGEPGRISVSIDPEILVINQPDVHAIATATVFDVYDNPVIEGSVVEFTATLGEIVSSVEIDENGQAQARFTPGEEPGYSQIRATTEGVGGTIEATTTILLELPLPQSLNFRIANDQLAVAGQNENASSSIFAEILDENGQVIDSAFTVGFEVVNDLELPHGCSLGDDEDRQLIYVQAEHGIALSTVHSGDSLGVRSIRAFTWRDEERTDTISASLDVNVVPGEAAQMTMHYNPEPISGGGGTWLIEVWIDALDAARFPVVDGTGVSFRLDSNVAGISNIGLTNTPGLRGNAMPGRAYATITYTSEAVFNEVEASAVIYTAINGEVRASTDVILPLSGGMLTLAPSPGNWNFGEDGDVAQIQIVATLRDGQRNLVNNGSVRFVPEVGSLYYYDEREQNLQPLENGVKITGQEDANNFEEPGEATVYLVIEEDEGFPFADDPDDPDDNIVVITVEASLDCYRDVVSEPLEITLTRPQE